MSRFYITTPLYYVNASPHLGHAYSNVIADTIARYHRLRGEETFLLTGTDEHGAKVSRSAEQQGKSPRIFVDEQVKGFLELARVFHISNDTFIRTSDQKEHWPGAQALWKKLEAAGDIYKAAYKGMYCVGHEAFVTEKDLVNGKCVDHDAKPEIIEEENYFFRISRYADRIREAVASDALEVVPIARKNEVLAMFRDGIEDVSFSRPAKDIPWGIPVPSDETQNMYVWCDALSNYISALGYGTTHDRNFRKFWPADMHVIGKDILRFHAILWPGMLLSGGLPLPKKILIHGLILSGGKKMSKTLGNIIDPLLLQKTYGTDAVRNFLVSEVPPFEDGDITLERFGEVYNSKLSNGIGNLVSRIANMIEQFCGGKLVRPDNSRLSTYTVSGAETTLHINNARRRHAAFMNETRINEAAGLAWKLLADCDKYIQTYEPFKLIKNDPENGRAVLWNAALLLFSGVQLLEPVMPQTTEHIYDVFGVPASGDFFELQYISGKRVVPLFPRLEK